MGVKKGKKIRRWLVSEKLEIVKARENGLTYREIESMYGVYSSSLTKWMRGYEQTGT